MNLYKNKLAIRDFKRSKLSANFKFGTMSKSSYCKRKRYKSVSVYHRILLAMPIIFLAHTGSTGCRCTSVFPLSSVHKKGHHDIMQKNRPHMTQKNRFPLYFYLLQRN
jgi:hypothetical protein